MMDAGFAIKGDQSHHECAVTSSTQSHEIERSYGVAEVMALRATNDSGNDPRV